LQDRYLNEGFYFISQIVDYFPSELVVLAFQASYLSWLCIK